MYFEVKKIRNFILDQPPILGNVLRSIPLMRKNKQYEKSIFNFYFVIFS